jgi:hypothetical protein
MVKTEMAILTQRKGEHLIGQEGNKGGEISDKYGGIMTSVLTCAGLNYGCSRHFMYAGNQTPA